MTIPSRPFSQRFEVRPAPPRLRPDEVPETMRVRFVTLVDRLRGKYLPGAYTIGRELAAALSGTYVSQGSMPQIQELVSNLEWWKFYDAAEALLGLTSQPAEVAVEIDALFSSEGSPYSMTASGIQWRLTAPAEEAVKEVDRLLDLDERFLGPAEQWCKAKHHLAERPPDAENCVKDATGAMEGVARLISKRHQDTLGQIIKHLAEQLGMHGALAKAVSALYGYRGDEQAVAHGATRELPQVVYEAEMVLHWTAATITYMVKKESHPSQAGDQVVRKERKHE